MAYLRLYTFDDAVKEVASHVRSMIDCKHIETEDLFQEAAMRLIEVAGSKEYYTGTDLYNAKRYAAIHMTKWIEQENTEEFYKQFTFRDSEYYDEVSFADVYMDRITWRMTPRERECIMLFYVHECPMKDIAKMYGTTPTNMSQIIGKARRKMYDGCWHLDIYGYGDITL